MSTFSQWWTTFSAKEEVRQITWLCGTEPILIEEVVDSIRASLGVHPWNYQAYRVGEDPERDIWNDLDRHSIDQGFRLVVIRNAEGLTEWERWLDWVKNRTTNPKTYVVFVSNEEKAPTVGGDKKGEKPTVAPHVAVFSRRGHVIECRPFTQTTAKHAVSWMQSKARLRDNVAGHLLNRANGNLRLARDMSLKLAVLGDDITIQMVNALLAERPRESFEDALMARHKREALLALERLPEGEYSRVVGRLDSNLDLAGLIYDMTSAHANTGEIVRAAGSRAFLVPALAPHAKHYDQRRRINLRRVLASADEALRGGAREGVMESIVALW